MRHRFIVLAAAAVFLGWTARSNAQFITFAAESGQNVISETNGPGGFTLNAGGGVGGTFSVYLNGADPLDNLYATALGLPLNQQVDVQDVTLTTSAVSDTAPMTPGLGTGDAFTQRLQGMQFSIVTTTVINGLPVGTVLLSGTASRTRIIGTMGSSDHTITSTDDLLENVVFHSDIATVDAQLQTYLKRSYSFVATGRNPANGYGAANPLYLNSGSGTYTGNFAVSTVPEPGVLGLLFGSGIGGSLLCLRRRRR